MSHSPDATLDDAKEELAQIFFQCARYERPSLDWKQALDDYTAKLFAASEIRPTTGVVESLIGQLRQPISHTECEDAWYSCSQHPDCADDRRRGEPCDCGAQHLIELHAHAADALSSFASSATATMLFVNGDCRAEVKANHEAAFAKLMTFFNDHKCWSGESFMQRGDDTHPDALDVLCDILDLIEPKVTYDE